MRRNPPLSIAKTAESLCTVCMQVKASWLSKPPKLRSALCQKNRKSTPRLSRLLASHCGAWQAVNCKSMGQMAITSSGQTLVRNYRTNRYSLAKGVSIMNRAFHVISVLSLLVSTLLLGNPLVASAAGGPPPTTVGAPPGGTTITGYNLTCSGFTVSGTTTASWIQVNNNITTPGVTVYPVSGGTYTVTVTFASPKSVGYGIDVEVKGVTTSGGGWDGQMYSYI